MTQIPVRRLRFLPALILLAVAACNDAPSAPHARLAAASVPTLDFTTGVLDTSSLVSRSTIRLNVKKDTTWQFAHGFVNFPARAVCSTSSSYGPGTWDSPCALSDTAVTITVYSWLDANGHPTVVFKPSLRFAPKQTVTLTLEDTTASPSNVPPILWCDNSLKCIDESLTDASAKSAYTTYGGISYVYRRVKHFSGYTLGAGIAAPDVTY